MSKFVIGPDEGVVVPPVMPPPGDGGGGSSTPVIKTATAGSIKTETRYRTSRVQETVVHTVSDDGTGGLGESGTVNYSGKSINLRLVSLNATTDGYKSDYEDSSSFENF